ncbi:MAG TPA: hypothetical protein VMX38_05435 [Verrucomicrobiae bacterium]|jgi:hypothetical protein|nr:hypothetical protein [Verrucomicrobiae bacterium]
MAESIEHGRMWRNIIGLIPDANFRQQLVRRVALRDLMMWKLSTTL